jgi:rhamnosyltransferase
MADARGQDMNISAQSEGAPSLKAPHSFGSNITIAAIIVLYHPDLVLLERLLESVLKQVNIVFIIDNTPIPSSEFSEFIRNYLSRVSYIALGDNMGIAAAQNAGIGKARGAGYSHVLLLDQDSFPHPHMVSELVCAERKLLRSGNAVASVGPIFIDEKSGATSKAIRHAWAHVKRIPTDTTMTEPIEADYLIASGSLIRMSILTDVGLMKEELFIDWVDIEWGLRARDLGKKCYMIPSAVMVHTIGDTYVHFMGKKIDLHSDTRHYYIVRNATYLLRLTSMGWRWRSITLLKIPSYVCLYSWLSRQRLRTLGVLGKAFLDGIRGKVGRLA